jgi:hypothetical protein
MGEAPQPKSPPRYPDLCGRRRLQLEVQILNREVGFLEVRTNRRFHLFVHSSFSGRVRARSPAPVQIQCGAWDLGGGARR